jgi:DNA-binding MarR family transcriptional regulator
MAVENYDPALTKRFIESRKYGKELINLLDKNPNGIRHIELSKKLGISPQYLSKLLREFQEQGLISRARKKKVSIIKLGLTGRAYMRENENHLPSEKDKYYLTPEPTAIVAENVEPYMSIPKGREKVPSKKK